MDDSVISRSIRHHLIAALLIGVALIGCVGGWAATATLSGAVVSQGHFVVDSYVKRVQHPTGGVVGEILVTEGDRVSAGDVLIRLDATQLSANLAIITKRLDELNARLARLQAERDELPEIVFPADLLARQTEEDVATALHSERHLFAFRREMREGKKAQLSERIAQYEYEIEGLKMQQLAFEQGLSVLEKEIEALRTLFAQGIVNTQRLNALETQAATFGGERGEKIANQAQVAGRIAEVKLQILSIDQELKTEVARELREIQAQMGEYVERKIAAVDALKRIDIVAPQSGIVHQLAVHTRGGVIGAAETILSIVPDGDNLALEVQISPVDIDQVRLGQPAVLRLSAFNQRTTPELNGTVSRIGADLSRDENTGLSWYGVRISIEPQELERLNDLTLVAGMPAEVLIETGERTALSYLMKPLSDQLARAFREE